ncbi:MAG: 3-methyl-2-oxobutanoate dehydrogenase subunit VorB [Planctomycetes bacterium]|nr:3-methyl-2-oxobutanoate dehydrogenase subunit VorB [Planctomycetota bacterium]
MATERPKVLLQQHLCKGCGRCIESCPKHAITLGTEVDQASGLVPVMIDEEKCNDCGLCISACPEPFGLMREEYELEHPEHLFGERERPRATPRDVPPHDVPLPRCEPMVLKGNYAAAVGALLAGCRHVFGYPITPSTEGAELCAKLLPKLDGVFLQACSEVATVNHMYGASGAGVPTLTFTSSPGFSLMLEGISYMIGAELPGVFINVMRPGPGLGNIGPEQADIKLAARGLGHGNTHAIVLAPSSPQEMLDLTMLAFELSLKYRNPVIVAADGYLGQITGRVTLPTKMSVPGLPDWAVWGDAEHRNNLINSIYIDWADLEEHNRHLSAKYRLMEETEQRATGYRHEDAEVLIVACNIPARMAKAAVAELRDEGLSIGLFQPLTIWPFPIKQLVPLLGHAKRLIVVEASDGQLEDELRLALHKADVTGLEIHHLRRMGGMLPSDREIVAHVHQLLEVSR